MLFVCYLHVICMLFACYLHVICMLFACHLDVTEMLFVFVLLMMDQSNSPQIIITSPSYIMLLQDVKHHVLSVIASSESFKKIEFSFSFQEYMACASS